MADDQFVEIPDLDALRAAPVDNPGNQTNPTAPPIKVGKSGITYPSGNVPPGGELESFLHKLLPEAFGAKDIQSGVNKLKDPNASSTGGMADLLEGAGKAGMATVGIPELGSARGLMALLGGLGGGFGGRRVATALGTDPETARLTGDLTGMGTGALASRVPASALELLKTGPLSKVALLSKLFGGGGGTPAAATPVVAPKPTPTPVSTSRTLQQLLTPNAPPQPTPTPTPTPTSTARTAAQLLTPQAPPAPAPVPGKSPSIVPNYAQPAPEPASVPAAVSPNRVPLNPAGTNAPMGNAPLPATPPKMVQNRDPVTGKWAKGQSPAPTPTDTTTQFLNSLFLGQK